MGHESSCPILIISEYIMASLYKMPLTSLNGIGTKKALLFNKLGINCVGDLITFYPRTYEDWSNIKNISELEYGETCCVKAVLGTPVSDARISGNRIVSRCTIYDETGTLKIVFFNNRYISSMLEVGKEYFFYGKVTFDSYGAQMISPTFSAIQNGININPIYKQTSGLNNKNIVNAVHQAISLLPKEIHDPLPEQVQKSFGLCDYKTALCNIHFPKNTEQLKEARKRLIVQELVVLNLGMQNLKNHGRGQSGIKINKDYSDEFEKLLPFSLTGAQRSAIGDCINDILKNTSPMSRLIQGDVGSGKTAVAASVCYTVIKNGYQTAFMAPTEILARQHYETFKNLFSDSNINVGLLIGSMKESEKKLIRTQLYEGAVNLIVGTHALITDKTEFSNLGLAITDEQHRFGVAQRSKLVGKGNNPHLLVMSATPIPRTLGLIMFGDLDISIINELPPNRKPVKTMLLTSNNRHKIYEFIRNEVDSGRQAYIVCPLVEEGEADDVVSAEEHAAELMLKEFADIPIGILHGQMKTKQKDEVMQKFADGEFSILVSTTVIEVGIDVPNASVIVIENAERFGLSQLHQLRGRVGRGNFQSYCIMVSDKQNPVTKARLEVMCSTNDGFKIADEDLKMRGPGDFFGERQHGLPQLSIADFADTENLELSRKIVDYILFVYKDIRCDELKYLKNEIDRLFARGGQHSLN